MTPLRVGFDMDGVLADFASAYRQIETRLFGPQSQTRAGDPEDETPERSPSNNDPPAAATLDSSRAPSPHDLRRRRDLIWQVIHSTPDFWTTLAPVDAEAVRRIRALSLRHRWDVVFITQRPATDGESVQRQTQRWLVEQGFDLPSVLVITGSRGAAAAALRLDYHVDDSPKNCVDVKSESPAKPILIAEPGDETTAASAKKLGIGIARTVGDCLDLLERASVLRAQPTLLTRVARLVGLG